MKPELFCICDYKTYLLLIEAGLMQPPEEKIERTFDIELDEGKRFSNG